MKKLTHEEIRLRIESLALPYKFKLSKDITIHSKLIAYCSKHGIFPTSVFALLYNKSTHRCPGCKHDTFKGHFHWSKKTRIEVRKDRALNFIARSQKRFPNNDYSKVLKHYVDFYTKVPIKCSTHGWFEQSPKGHRGNTFGCPACSDEAASRTKSEKAGLRLTAILNARKGLSYDPSLYQGRAIPWEVQCKKHGPFIQLPLNSVKSGCPACAAEKMDSEIQRKVTTWVKSLGQKVIGNAKGIAKPFDLDIYLPEHALAIEVNGNYWHSEIRRNKDYHFKKYIIAKKAGVRVIQFWEHELLNSTPLVKSMIRSRLGLSRRSIYARKCDIVNVDPKQANEFLRQNHLRSTSKSKVRIGLQYEDELVALMTFDVPRFNRDVQWELIRFCIARNTSVVGGASRLLKAFEIRHKPLSLLSYSDIRYSEGYLYKELGFDPIKKTEPNYFYMGNGQLIIPRYKAQKHKLHKLLGEYFDPEKTEVENMLSAGFLRVWDCGNLLWIKTY